jgi:hypothetical protein
MTKEHTPLINTERILTIFIAVTLMFSITRYTVDGFALQMMGRSLSQGGDFQNYYIPSALFVAGKNMYDREEALKFAMSHPSVEYSYVSYYLYPPLLAIVLAPLSQLPFPTAYRVWVVLQQVFLVGTLLLLARSLPMFGRWSLPILTVLACNMYPFYLSNDMGQVNVLILLLVAAALDGAIRGRMFFAGVMIGIATMIKISPLLLIGLFVLQRRWPAVWGFVVSMALLTTLSALIAGPEAIQGFINVSLMRSIPDQVRWINNASPSAFIHRMFEALHIGQFEMGVRWLTVLIVLGVLGLCSLKQVKPDDPIFALIFGFWVLGTHLISPITWEHHLVLTLLVFGVTAGYLVQMKSRHVVLLAVILGMNYSLIAFENLTLNRFGQWQFGRGWWIFSGNYLREYFYADVRLLALSTLFCLIGILLFQSQARSFWHHAVGRVRAVLSIRNRSLARLNN